MFQSLRQNSQIFIFHKDIPSLEIGYVNQVSLPKPKYAVPQMLVGQQQEMVVDLVVKVNGALINYNSLPATLDIADSFTNGDNIVIADSKEAINSEISAYKQKNQDLLNNTETYQKIVTDCDKILQDLNPEYAQKQQQQTEINVLKDQMSDMSKNLATLTSMIERLTKEKNHEQNVGNKRV